MNWTPEQLRKFAEAGLDVMESGGCLQYVTDEGWLPIEFLPNDLAACFEVLEKECLGYRLVREDYNLFIVEIPYRESQHSSIQFHAGKGETKQDAIIAAVLAAHNSEGR